MTTEQQNALICWMRAVNSALNDIAGRVQEKEWNQIVWPGTIDGLRDLTDRVRDLGVEAREAKQ